MEFKGEKLFVGGHPAWDGNANGNGHGMGTAHSGYDAAHCQAVGAADFSNILDAPTQVSETNVSPNVGFVLLLPVSNWNGKLLHVGCGGWCDSTAFVPLACASHAGYACIGTDMGHTVKVGCGRAIISRRRLISARATHVATPAGKAIVERYYAAAPNKSYFMGCSAGGYQGMVEAQRFPWDFNGIIAGALDMDESDLAVRGIWLKRNFIGNDGKPVLSPEDVRLLHEAVLAKCDMDDGVNDGIAVRLIVAHSILLNWRVRPINKMGA